MTAVNLPAWSDQVSWPTPHHRALALAIAADDGAHVRQAAAHGVPATGLFPSLQDEESAGEGLATWAGLGWLAVAMLADKPHAAQALVETGASLMQPDEAGAPLALTPFLRHREDWVRWLDDQGFAWTASHPQAAHGYGPLALVLSGRGPSRDRLVEHVLGRPGQWDESSRTAVWLALAAHGSVTDMPRLAAVGLRWEDTSSTCREAILAAALLGHQHRRPEASAWLDHLARARVPLSISYTYIHPAIRDAYAQRLLACSGSVMAAPAGALDPLASPPLASLPPSHPASTPNQETWKPGDGASVMGSPRRRPAP